MTTQPTPGTGQPASSHEHLLPTVPFPVDRLDFLSDLCRGQRVLHVGCADDTAIEEKLSVGRHVHARISAVAAHTVGIDVAVERLASLAEHGLKQLVAGTASRIPFRANSFDIVLLGEILEHLADPGMVLKQVRESGVASHLVVTVPNAYSYYLARRVRQGTEVVNPDHLYTFTPVTLSTLLHRSGWRTERLLTYAWTLPAGPVTCLRSLGGKALGRAQRLSVRPDALRQNLRLWSAYRKSPFLADGLIAVAS
jgi:hypothetical protein